MPCKSFSREENQKRPTLVKAMGLIQIMKISFLLLGVGLFLLDGCATNPRPDSSVPPSSVSFAADDLWVISATYGSGVSFADVTYRVNGLLHQPSVEFFARPEWVHADPTPGWNKALVIVYEFKGRRHIFSTGEGGKVSLELLIRQAKKN